MIALPLLIEIRVDQARPRTADFGIDLSVMSELSVIEVEAPERLSREGNRELTVRMKGGQARAVSTPTEVSTGPERRWRLDHDLSRLYSEVAVATRFLRHASAIAHFWLEAGRDKCSNSFVDYRAGKLILRSEVIESLFSGQQAEFFSPTFTEIQPLAFDVVELSFESPFFGKLKPYLEWDSKIGISGVAGVMGFLLALGSCHPAPKNPDITIKIKVIQKAAAPAPAKGDIKSGAKVYTQALQLGGIAEIQHALFLAGLDPGPADGKDGPQTRKAAQKFCDKAGIKFAGYNDPKFVNALATRLGNSYHYFAGQP